MEKAKKWLKKIFIALWIILLPFEMFRLYGAIERAYIFYHADINFIDTNDIYSTIYINPYYHGRPFIFKGKKYCVDYSESAAYDTMSVKIDGKQKTFVKDSDKKHYVIYPNESLWDFIIFGEGTHMTIYEAKDDSENEVFFSNEEALHYAFFSEDIIDHLDIEDS